MSLIDPSKLPGDKIDAAAVSSGASTISTLGTTITTGGGDTVRAWQAISGSYQSDGAEHLYSVMTPVGTATTSVGDGLGSVASALSTYAETVGPIKTGLDTLKTEAEDFVRRAKSFQPRMQDSDDGYVIASQAVSTMGVSLITGTKVEITSWDQDPDMVDENNRLIRRGADLAEEWLAAQQTCANAILAAACLAPLPGTSTGTPAQIMAAAEASLPWAGESDIDTPWGSTGDRKESCGEKAAGFPAHLVKGVVVDGLGGMAKGLSSLLTGWDGTGIPWYAEAIAGGITGRSDMVDDAFGRAGQTYGGAWLGLGHLASALTPVGTVVNTLGNSPLGDFLPKDTQQFLSDWGHDDTTALADTVGGLVGLKLPDQWWESSSWDGYNIAQSWVDDPGGTAGASAFNIGTLFIPGAGEASAGAHATAAAADAAGDVARAGGFVDDAARAARGADEFVNVGHGLTVGDLVDGVRGVDAGDVAKVTREGDLPTTGVDLVGDAGKVDVSTPHADAPSAPAPHAEAPRADAPSASASHADAPSTPAARPEAPAPHVDPPNAGHPSVERGETPTAAHDEAPTAAHSETPAGAHGDSPVAPHGDTPAGAHDDTPSPAHGDDTPPAQHGDAPAPHDTPPTTHLGDDGVERTVRQYDSGSKGAWNTDLYHKAIEANTRYEIDGGKWVYETDEHARVVHAEGHLDQVVKELENRSRHGGQQTAAGGADRLRVDHGGHIFATLFGGPGEGINLTAQWSKVNLGAYKALENQWAAAIDSGRSVRVEVNLTYPDRFRPSRYDVEYQIGDGPIRSARFSNAPTP
ncbi:DNA/RNA non-specific endonuclease [Curtobacterium sp. Csp1]|uniref:DNA/RNA non-specific endonuclease n=1 Tax=unclassified Curtobacterium TaxID=257496 RepID=UPI001597C767|nr:MULTISPECIES: DNA/RNA non-specific endonuclease [unclassified Curtobacterium]QKS11730.1 DNA/RNA non-specific endonuclease [Curtobacterium sp. csp3]QKS18526.1 DNA/RNA non-specific endonuclease [Curtobacterium sp. Csp1]